MGTSFYLLLDGIVGNSTLKGVEGAFELDWFGLGQSQSGSTHSGGPSINGSVNFRDLSVVLSGNEGLIELLDRVSTGALIDRLQIVGITDEDQLVYDLRLHDVLASNVAQIGEPGESPSLDVAFNFGKIGLFTTNVNPDGSLAETESYGFDLTTNTIIDAGSVAAPETSAPVDVATPTTYYMLVDGVVGSAGAEGHVGWIELEMFSLAQSNSGLNQSGGGSSSSANFEDLTVAFLGTVGLADLLTGASTGEIIDALRIEGVNNNNATVYQLTLNDVIVSAVAQGATPGEKQRLEVGFDFAKFGIETTAQNSNGNLGAEQSFAWDIPQNLALDPADLDEPSAAAPLNIARVTDYFLRIDGVAGDSTVEDFEGWFELDSFSLGQLQSGTTQLGAGGGAGRVSLQDLAVTLSGNAGLAGFLSMISMAEVVTALEVVGISNDNERIYELTLNDVYTSSVKEVATQNDDPNLSVSFGYNQIGVITTHPNLSGPNSQESYGWDDVSSQTIDPNSLDKATPLSAVTTGTPTTYFLSIDGMGGDATAKGYSGWFELDMFSLGQSQQNVLQPGGGGATHPDIQDLSVTLSGLEGLAGFLDAASEGDIVRALRIEGIGQNNERVYQLTLNDVIVSAVLEAARPNADLSLEVQFNFGKIGLVTTSQNPDGSLGADQTYGWDIALNEAITPAALDAPTPSPSVNIAPPDTYFMWVDGIVGDVSEGGFDGAFELNGFNLGQFQSGTTQVGAGGTEGLVSFQDLAVSLSGNAGLTEFLANTSDGSIIDSIQILGVIGEDADKTYELVLNDILVTSVAESAIHTDVPNLDVAFNFAKIGLKTFIQNPDGSFGGEQFYGWDVASQTSLGFNDLSKPGSSDPVSVGEPDFFYLLVDGIEGDSTDQGREGWFKLDMFSLGQSNSGTTHDGSGGGAGRPSFDDLVVSLTGTSGLTEFLNGASTGTVKQALRIEGVTFGDETVYQLTLNDIIVSDVSEATVPHTGASLTVSFNFGQIGVVTTPQDISGNLGEEQSYAWDVAANRAIAISDLQAPTLDNNPPVITSDGGGESAAINAAENQRGVTEVQAEDPDSGTELTYVITGGDDAAAFSIDRTDGTLTFDVAPDFEAPTDANGDNIYQVIVQSLDGFLSDSQTINVTVTDMAGSTIIGTDGSDLINLANTVAGQSLPTDEENVIDGGGGNDLIGGGAGADRLSGGDGLDRVQYNFSDAGVIVDLNADGLGIQSASGGDAEGDVLSGFEHVDGSAYSDTLTGDDGRNVLIGRSGADDIHGGADSDLIRGNGGDDTLSGDGGDDTIYGGGGDDILDGGAGSDELFGRAGNDTARFTGLQGSFAFAQLIDGRLSVTDANGDVDLLRDIEQLEFTDGNVSIADVLGGLPTDGNDTLDGTEGDDVIDALGGDDLVNGFGGNDEIIGGAGDDKIFGNGGEDNLSGGAGDDDISGGAASDTVTGGDNQDSILGQSGDDDINGNNGDDDLGGGNGNDNVRGGNGNDDVRGGTGNDDVRGGGGNDTIFGGSGDDQLRGGSGNDNLVSGLGTDILDGGSGDDVFVFNAVGESLNDATSDTITDFTRGEDLVDLSGLGDGLTFIGGAVFTGAGGEVRFTTTNATTVIRADLDGDGSGEFKIVLDGVLGGIDGLDLIL